VLAGVEVGVPVAHLDGCRENVGDGDDAGRGCTRTVVQLWCEGSWCMRLVV
jgi:hypothetical protein